MLSNEHMGVGLLIMFRQNIAGKALMQILFPMRKINSGGGGGRLFSSRFRRNSHATGKSSITRTDGKC